MSVVLGLTGGIGSGKSTVLAMLAEFGIETVSADEINAGLLAKDEDVRREIAEAFGEDTVTNDGINKQKLAAIVFNDDGGRKKLESITLPRIISEMRRRIADFRSEKESEALVVEVPLLFECHLEKDFDKILSVVTEQRTRIDRLKNKRKMTEEDILARISKQIAPETQMAMSDYVIVNDGDPESLRRKVAALRDVLSRLSKQSGKSAN
ncbi:MAG: dephospho-CoA kinase [Abditibacteriota bacterium]|nr:dephospho-CoA kinase [Abditibacteriota bacterium]